MVKLDKNGYANSILQPPEEQFRCYLCGRTDQKLDRHEIWGGAYRVKSKRLGLWVCLCHQRCHLNGVHADGELARCLKATAQAAAMERYRWDVDAFRAEFGRNYQ